MDIAEPITKVGIKTFVSVKLLEKIQGLLMELPEKRKTQLEAKDAIAFLYQDIRSALEKDYTLGEISQLLQSSGWEITENSLRYFWKMSRLENEKEKRSKRNVPSKNARKDQGTQLARAVTEDNALAEAAKLALSGERKEVELDAKSTNTKHKEKSGSTSSVEDRIKRDEKRKDSHFELQPDTEDL